MIAGQLEIQLLTNMAQIRKDMGDMVGIYQKGARDISDALETVKKAAEVVGVALGVKELVEFVGRVNDATAKMKDLGAQAGVTAEAISRFELPARAAGSSLDSVSTAMFRMSKAALESQDPTSKAAEALRAIGLSAKDLQNLKPDQMFELVARRLAEFSDGIGKNNVMQALFNKSGAEMNKVVKGIAESGQLAATVTNQQAEEANHLNTQMIELKMKSEEFWRNLIAEGVPALTAILTAFMDARKEAGLWEGAIAATAEAMKVALGDGTEKARERLAQVNDELKQLYDGQQSLSKMWFVSENAMANFTARSNQLLEERGKLQNQINQAVQIEAQQRAAAAQKPEDKPDPVVKHAVSGAGDDYVQRLQNELDKLNGLTGASNKYSQTLAEIQKLQRQGIPIDAERAKQISKAIDDEITLREQTDAYNKVLDALDAVEQAKVDRARQIVEGQQDEIERMKLENSLIGATAEAQHKANIEYERKIALRGQDDPTTIQAINRIYDEKEAVSAIGDTLRQQSSIWGQLGNESMTFFSDLILHGKSAFDGLKQWAKEFLAQMIAIFATRWILQLAGAGSGSIASVGASTLAGSALNYLSTGSSLYSGATGAYSLYNGGTGIAGAASSMLYGNSLTYGLGVQGLTPGSAQAAALAQQTGVFGQSGLSATNAAAGGGVNSGLVTAGIYAAIIAAGIASMQLWKSGWGNNGSTAPDSMKNPLAGTWVSSSTAASLRFLGLSDRDAATMAGMPLISRVWGHSATHADAYGVMGNLGPGGITGSNWQDFSQKGGLFSHDNRWTDTSALTDDQKTFFAAFYAGLKNVTDMFGNLVKVDPTEVLKDYTHAFNFQLSNNGAPISDADMNALFDSMFTSVLQDQVTQLLAAGGHDRLADYVKQLTGATADIQQSIVDLLGVMGGTAASGLKNFTAEAVMDWEHAGETLGQAFQRIMTSWGQLQDAFTPDAVKLQMAQEQLHALYTDLTAAGAQLPTTREGWLDVMRSLDLSTEAGRNLFDRMLALAPTFDAVSQAADQAAAATAGLIASLQQSLGAIYGPDYTAGQNKGALNGLLSTFQSLNAWTNGMSLDQIMQALLTIDPNGADFAAYNAAGQGQLIASILQMYAQMNPYQNGGGGGGGYSGASNGLDQFIQSLADAQKSLRDWVHGLFLNDQLSPLTPEQKLVEAKKQYQDTLWLAQNGNLSAMGNLSSVAQAYLEIARQLYASSPAYNAIFADVVTSVGTLGGLTQDQLNTSLYGALPATGDTIMSQSQGARIEGAVLALLDRISNGTLTVHDPDTKQAVDDLALDVQGNGGALK